MERVKYDIETLKELVLVAGRKGIEALDDETSPHCRCDSMMITPVIRANIYQWYERNDEGKKFPCIRIQLGDWENEIARWDAYFSFKYSVWELVSINESIVKEPRVHSALLTIFKELTEEYRKEHWGHTAEEPIEKALNWLERENCYSKLCVREGNTFTWNKRIAVTFQPQCDGLLRVRYSLLDIKPSLGIDLPSFFVDTSGMKQVRLEWFLDSCMTFGYFLKNYIDFKQVGKEVKEKEMREKK